MMMKDKTAIFLKCGNLTLIHLLLTVEDAGPEGISTMQLFKELGTTGYGQITLRRAVKEGYVKRIQGEEPGPGQFPTVFNVITQKGRELLQNQLSQATLN